MNSFSSQLRESAERSSKRASTWNRASMVFLVFALPAGVLINTTGDVAYFVILVVWIICHLLCLYMASKYSNLSELCLKQAMDYEKLEASRKRCGVLASRITEKDSTRTQ